VTILLEARRREIQTDKMLFLILSLLHITYALKPNIVYIMTDDQDIELGGMTPMPKTRKLLGEQGATAEAFYIVGLNLFLDPNTAAIDTY